MEKRIDLHIHTTSSDGKLTPKQVIDEAYKNNVTILAIADHDTVDAYSEDLFAYARNNNIQLISSVEISTKTEKAGIHVLGYNLDLNNEEFKEKLRKIKGFRHEYLHNVGKKLNELGYYMNLNELDKIEAVTKAHIALDKIEAVTKAHIALDIINSPNNKEKLLTEFGHIPNKGEFIETIMNEGCPAYVKKESITPKEAAEIIRKAKGKVVLAHPVAYIYEDNFNEEDILDIIKAMKPDGVEAIYIYVDKYNKRIDEVEKWKEFAKKNNLFVTAGSDFHAEDDIRPQIGFVNTNLVLSENEIEDIICKLKITY